MKLWIVGKNGLLGATLGKLCEERKIVYMATESADVDIRNFAAISTFLDRHAPTHIINCAAYTAVDLAEKESEMAFAINAFGAENLARCARERGRPLLHLSTNYIFDGKNHKPYHETDLANPLSVYGRSKWEGELRVMSAHPSACIIRTSWLFGNQGKNFVSSLLHSLKTEKTIRAAVDQTGRITYGKDLAEAILSLLEAEGVFHYANAGTVSRYELACAVRESARRKGIPIKTEEIVAVAASTFSAPAPRPDRAVLATQKIEKKMIIRHWSAAFEEYLSHEIR